MCTLQISVTECRLGVGDVGPHKVVCNLQRQAGPDCSSILFLYACAPKSIKTNSTPPAVEYINFVNIQTALPAISTWYSYLRKNYIAQQKGQKGRLYNMDTHMKTQLSFVTVTKRKKYTGCSLWPPETYNFFHLLKLQQIKSCCHFFLLHVIPSKFCFPLYLCLLLMLFLTFIKITFLCSV